MPNDLIEAIAHANKVLDWFENLAPNEVPPEWMWPFSEEINDWFDNLRFQKEMNTGSDETVSGEVVKNEDPRLEKLRALRGS